MRMVFAGLSCNVDFRGATWLGSVAVIELSDEFEATTMATGVGVD